MLSQQKRRQEPDSKKACYQKNESTGEVTCEAYEEFSYEDLFNKLDNEDTLLTNSTERKKIIEGLAHSKAQELIGSALMKIFSLIIDSTNPKLELDVLIRCYNLPLRENQSDARIAKLHGISRQAFSVRVGTMCELLNVRPPRTLKAPEHKQTYRDCNKRNFKPPTD